MKIVIALLLTACLAPLAWGQVVQTESVTADGSPGLKITTSSRASFYVIKAVWNGKPVMVFPVAHTHAVSSCTGALVVGAETVIYRSQNNPKDDFLFSRAEVQQFHVKMWRALGKDMWWRLEVKVKGRDYTFTPLAERAVPTMEQDFFAPLKWAQRAWTDFQGVVQEFDSERSSLGVKAEVPPPPPPKPLPEPSTKGVAATTQDGRKVLLLSDGTWKYEKAEAGSVIQLTSTTESGQRIVYQALGSPFYHSSSSCRLSTSLVRPVSLENAIKEHAQHCSLCFSSAPEIQKIKAASIAESAPALTPNTQTPSSMASAPVARPAASSVPAKPAPPAKNSNSSGSSKRSGYYINGNGNKTYVDRSLCR